MRKFFRGAAAAAVFAAAVLPGLASAQAPALEADVIPRVNMESGIIGGAAGGSCSSGGHATQAACEAASATWTATGATGVRELQSMQTILIGVVIAMVLAFAAWRLGARWIGRGSGGMT